MLKDTIWFESVDEKWRITSTVGSRLDAGVCRICPTVLDIPGIGFESFEFERGKPRS